MKVLVLGGDGFCGWPTALHLSAHGHDVVIVDNFSRRKIDVELGVESLTPIRPLDVRLAAWKRRTGHLIPYRLIDVAEEYDALRDLIERERPNAVVHFAEQRAAPYSMKNPRTRRYTVDNNLRATHNLLSAIVETGLDVHVIHLGTMGVYGYTSANVMIPEGYLLVKMKGIDGQWIERVILYPPDPGSIYHMTKTQDQLFFYFYNKNYGLAITDLHQGIVWGTETDETLGDDDLLNRYDYDGDYGTVLNRFVMQAVVGHDLTVYGTGGQTRAFIHIRDTVRCIRLAIENPPEDRSRVRIFNQATETHRVRDLANLVASLTGAKVAFLPNPRKEADENDLVIENTGLQGLGWEPVRLENGLLLEIKEIAERFAHRCDLSKIPCRSRW